MSTYEGLSTRKKKVYYLNFIKRIRQSYANNRKKKLIRLLKKFVPLDGYIHINARVHVGKIIKKNKRYITWKK